ncbi:MAG: hypothetical protein JW751_14465 [Polyangiaceae bacterium]|nr:hypothetical protein [Polyangiaceae bacterium]
MPSTLVAMALPPLVGLLLPIGCAASSPRLDRGRSAPRATAGAPVASTAAGVPEVMVPLHSMGITRLALLGYPYWGGRDAYAGAESAAARQQWSEVETRCREVLDVNPDHAQARRLLASALAMRGRHGEAVAQLNMALADDWLAWAPDLAADPTLRDLFAGAEREHLTSLVAAYEASFARSLKRGFWVVGRVSPYTTPPTNRGQQAAGRSTVPAGSATRRSSSRPMVGRFASST